jgi:hypothetical protein
MNANVGVKVENNGASSAGRLSAAEINSIVDAVNSKAVTAFVANVAALATVSGAADIQAVWVDSVGLFTYAGSGPANGQTIFAANGGGFWVLKRTAPLTNTLADLASIPVDASLGDIHKVTINGNRHFQNPSNLLPNQKVSFRIKQGAASVDGAGFTVTYDTKYRFPKNLTEPILSQGAGALDQVDFVYNADDDKLDCVGYSIGY